MFRRLLILIAFAATPAMGSAAEHENWSRFRGPNGCGVAHDVDFPATWTSDDYAWKIRLRGKGHSSPIGWGEHVFITAGDEATGDLTLSSIDAGSGNVEWTRSFPSAP